jgi:hypothetical protein
MFWVAPFAPIFNVAASPPIFRVVALESNNDAVPVEVVVTLPPLTAMLLSVVISPVPPAMEK